MYWRIFRNRLFFAFLFGVLCLPLLLANANQSAYKKWLDEEVHWIITPQERAEFLKLSSDQQRDTFVEAFWARRESTPNTPKHEFKEEHYRRLAYANEHFAAGVPGWRTDGGRVYIVYGSPDRIDFRNSGSASENTKEKLLPTGGTAVVRYPTQVWHYLHLKGLDHEVVVTFVDFCQCNDYKREIDPSGKQELP